MDDKERLKRIIKYLDLNQSKFAESIDYSADTINKIINGHAEISKNLARAITNKYPVINLYWLLTGQGKMKIDPNSQTAEIFRNPSFGDETESPEYIEERGYMSLLNENYKLKQHEAENKILKKLVQKLEDHIHTLTELKEIPKLDTQSIMKEFEEKCEKIFKGSVNRNFEKLTEEFEGKILRIIKKGRQDL